MRIEAVELRWLDLHLRRPHRSATGVEEARPVVMARVETGVGIGYGECAALATPAYAEEYADGAWAVLADHLVPRLLAALGPGGARGGPAPSSWQGVADAVAEAMSGVSGHHMAKACLEMAAVDAWLRGRDQSLADVLGVTVTSVEAGAVAGVHDRVEDLVAAVGELAAAGYRRVKVKIGPGWDTAPLGELRRAFPLLGLQADGNGAYGPEHTIVLSSLDGLGLLCLEQPFPADDLVALARLAAMIDTPVCLDEAATSAARLREAMALGACDMVCVKPGRLGGLRPAVEIHDWARAASVPLWVGGMLETGLARSANAALSALPGFVLPGDLSGGDRFVEEDPVPGPEPEDGRVALHTGPGVGPAPDPVVLAAVTARSARLTP
jgi:O-succinylbenzoate synthase